MSTPNFTFDAQVRTDLGKGASRRLRHVDLIPAILYGGNDEPVSLTLDHNKIINASEHDTFYTSILTLKIDGKKEQAILKDVQRHPFKPKITHLDLLRIVAGEAITTRIPIHFIGEEEVEKTGNTLVRHEVDVEISCLPADLPDTIEVDITNLEVGESVHLNEVVLPEGVTSVDLGRGEDFNFVIATIAAPVVESEEDEEVEADDSAEDTADTESSDDE